MTRDRGPLAGLLLLALLFVAALCALATAAGAQPAQPSESAYRAFPYVGSRLAVWAVAQLHLNFAAFILGVPIFAVIIEIIGWRTGDEGRRYDWLSHELVKLTFAAFSTTALLGALLLFLLFIGYYPKFWAYMTSIFFPTYWIYAALFFAETFTVYLWYYGWDWLSGSRKWIHVGLGVLSNLFGTAILFVANSWVTFMISPPAGIDDVGQLTGSVWAAINNFTWMPINIHRLIANVVFGGTIAAAYAAFRFLGAQDATRSAPATTGWATSATSSPLSAFIVLPFAGYWLGREIYALQPDDGHHDDGRLHVLAVDHPGHPHRRALPRLELLPVARHGAHPGLRAVPQVRAADAVHPHHRLHGVGHAAQPWSSTLDEARAMGGTHHRCSASSASCRPRTPS